MSGLGSWLHMGGYAVYIWTSYGLVSFVLVGYMVAIYIQKKRTLSFVRRWLTRVRS